MKFKIDFTDTGYILETDPNFDETLRRLAGMCGIWTELLKMQKDLATEVLGKGDVNIHRPEPTGINQNVKTPNGQVQDAFNQQTRRDFRRSTVPPKTPNREVVLNPYSNVTPFPTQASSDGYGQPGTEYKSEDFE